MDMGKLKISILKSNLIALIVSSLVVLLSKVIFGSSRNGFLSDLFFVITFICSCASIVIIIGNKFFHVFAFQKGGVLIVKSNRIYKWDDLIYNLIIEKIQHKVEFRDKNTGEVLFVLHIWWTTEESIRSLTKNFVPVENDLYKIVQEYAREKKLDF